MAIVFNAIACMLPLLAAAELEVAGMMMGSVLQNAIECPGCGARYSVIVPRAAAPSQLDRIIGELRHYVSATCGDHPPIIQSQ
jgi:hypothetical protein